MYLATNPGAHSPKGAGGVPYTTSGAGPEAHWREGVGRDPYMRVGPGLGAHRPQGACGDPYRTWELVLAPTGLRMPVWTSTCT